MLRAYDKATGKEVGAVYMPAPQSGSPMTYMLNGQQYIVRRDQRRQLFRRAGGVQAAHFIVMRRVVLGLGMSLDGYIARLNGDVDFLFMPKDYSMAPFFASIGAAIMGRKTLDDGLRMSGGSLSEVAVQILCDVPIEASGRARWGSVHQQIAGCVGRPDS